MAGAPSRGAVRAPRNAEITRSRILDAAEREFAARGFAGARLREIAAAARVQPALIHHYFADKSGLYEAVLDRGLELMHSVSWRVLEGADGVAPLVRGFVEVLVDFYASNEQLLAIVRNETLAGSTLLLDRARERLGPLLQLCLGIVEERQRAGEIRADLSPREIVLAGLSLILYPSVDAPFVDGLLPPPAGPDPLTRRKEVVVALLDDALRPPTRAAAPPKGTAASSAPPERAARAPRSGQDPAPRAVAPRRARIRK